MSDLPIIQKTPAARSLQEVLGKMKEAGLTPVEVTEIDVIQRVIIEHNVLRGELTYRREKLDALQAMAMLWDAIRIIARTELFSETRTRLNSGRAAIALTLDGNRIQAIHDPPNDPFVLVGILLADACRILDTAEGEDFDA